MDFISTYELLTGEKPGANSPELDPILDSTVKTAENTRFKVVKSGRLIEIYEAELPFQTGEGLKDTEPAYNYEKQREEEYAKRASHRARNKIKRLIYTNFNHQAKFITLTFRDTAEFDIKDKQECYLRLKDFIHRLRYRKGDFKYLIVPEYQMKNARGAVHYHIVANLPYIQNSTLASIWSHGFTKINLVTNQKKIGIYLSKYLTKSSFNENTKGLKRYYRSTDLKDETVYYGVRADALAKRFLDLYREHLQYMSSYESRNNGIIKYYEFNFIEEGG